MSVNGSERDHPGIGRLGEGDLNRSLIRSHYDLATHTSALALVNDEVCGLKPAWEQRSKIVKPVPLSELRSNPAGSHIGIAKRLRLHDGDAPDPLFHGPACGQSGRGCADFGEFVTGNAAPSLRFRMCGQAAFIAAEPYTRAIREIEKLLDRARMIHFGDDALLAFTPVDAQFINAR